MMIYFVERVLAGGVLLEAPSRREALASVNFGGRIGKTTARPAKPTDRSWTYGSVAFDDYVERDGLVYLKYSTIRRLFRIPSDVTVYSGLPVA